MARLGWSKGDNEIFYLDNLIKDFNIKEVQKAGAIFDITKLDWVNSQHLSNLSLEEFKDYLKPFLKEINIDINNHSNVNEMLDAMRSSDNTLSGIAQSLLPYYKDKVSYDEKAISKFLDGKKSILEDIMELLMKVDSWDEESIDSVLKEYQLNNELSTPAVNQPIRIALTGSTKSPSLGLTLSIFGKDAALTRISALIEHI